MSDDEKPSENSIPTENSIPPSPKEPIADAPIPLMDSAPAEVPSDAPEASRESFSDESNNIPLSNSTPTEAENESKSEEKQAPNEPNPEPVSEPVQAIEPPTAQISTNEPFSVDCVPRFSPLEKLCFLHRLRPCVGARGTLVIIDFKNRF